MGHSADIPTGTIGPFGPVATVVPANCRFDLASGDCTIDPQGTIHAFVAFRGGSCQDEPVIHYVRGSVDAWTPTLTPYRGHVLGMALDGTQPFLLYTNRDGIHITKQAEDGHFTSGRRIGRPSSPRWQPGHGDVIAADDRWWAVWAETNSSTPPREPYELFQASTMTSGAERRRERIGSALPTALHNIQPTLTLDPADQSGAVLAWTVVTADSEGVDGAVVRFARARRADARWREQAWVPPRPRPGRHVNGPDLLASDGNLHGAYEDDGRIVHALSPPGGAVANRFRQAGLFPRVAHSAGRTFVAWTANETPAHVFVGESTTAGVAGELDLNPGGGDQQLVGVVARDGKATVLGVSFTSHRLWVRAQT